jgi:hypothetical protein
MSASPSIGQLPYSSLGISYSKSVLNSSASHYMFPDSSYFTFVSPSPFIPIMTDDDTLIPLVGVGSVITPHLSLPNIYLILKLKLNLAFISQLCDSSDYLVIFSFSFCCV